MFLERYSDEKFFLKYLNDEEKTKEKNFCRRFCDDIIRYDDEELDALQYMHYQVNRKEENSKV